MSLGTISIFALSLAASTVTFSQTTVWRNTAVATGQNAITLGLAPGMPDQSIWSAWPRMGCGVQLSGPATLTEAIVYYDALSVDPLSTYRPQIQLALYANDGAAVVGSNGTIFSKPSTYLGEALNTETNIELQTGRVAYRFKLNNVSVPAQFTYVLTLRPDNNGPKTAAMYSPIYFGGPEIGGVQGPRGVTFQEANGPGQPQDWYAFEPPASYPYPQMAFGAVFKTGTGLTDPLPLGYDNTSPGITHGTVPLGDPAGDQHPFAQAGNVVTLEGSNRKLTSIDLNYQTTSISGAGEYRINILGAERWQPAVGGSGGSADPGHVYWSSDWQPIATEGGTDRHVTLSVPGVTVPSRFAWTMEVRGLTGSGADTAGLQLVDPGTVGASPNEYVTFDGTNWDTASQPGGTPSVLGPIKFTLDPATVLLPEFYNEQLGVDVSFDARRLDFADGVDVVVHKGFVPNQTTPLARADINFASTTLTPSSLHGLFRAHTLNPGQFTVEYGFKNWVTNQVELSPKLPIGVLYQSFSIDPTGDLSRFVSPSGLILMRVQIRRSGFIAVALPYFGYDFASVTVSP